jgi:hypothetical protein
MTDNRRWLTFAHLSSVVRPPSSESIHSSVGAEHPVADREVAGSSPAGWSNFRAWRSLAALLAWNQEVVGSNPTALTTFTIKQQEAPMRRDDNDELPSFRNLAQAEAGVMRPKRTCGAATASCTATRS